MSAIEVTAKLGKEEDGPSISVEFDFGDNLEEAVEKFGDDVVFSRFKSAAIIDLQALLRRYMGGEKPKTESEIKEIVAKWVPGVTQRKRKTDKQKAEELLGKLDAKTLAELLAVVTAKSGEASAG